MVNVLFVCLGNICRSPTAEGVFRTIVEREGLGDRISVDSAGTAAYHVGEAPDPRSRKAALRRGFDLGDQHARRARSEDFRRFDYILAMDRENHHGLEGICPPGEEHRLHLFLDFAPEAGRKDVPDPYYGGARGFDLVIDLIEEASRGLIADIRENHL